MWAVGTETSVVSILFSVWMELTLRSRHLRTFLPQLLPQPEVSPPELQQACLNL